MTQTKKGFTLVELLIVIGILGILAAAVVVVLNPAELLAQARDSQRLQDLSGLNSALSLFSVSTSTVELGDESVNITQGSGTCDEGDTSVEVTSRVVTGSGWVEVGFAGLTGGSPLAVLPVDPTNSGVYAYCYEGEDSGSAKTWELSTILESTKFATTENLDANDGGSSTTVYEVGTDLTLIGDGA